MQVCQHYSLPCINLFGLSEWDGFSQLWRIPPRGAAAHPEWTSHVHIADTVVFALRQQIDAMMGPCGALQCSAPAGAAAEKGKAVAAWPKAGLHTDAQLEAIPVCLESRSAFMASDLADPSAAVGEPGDETRWRSLPGVVPGDGWHLFADRPEKPGWITTTVGAKIAFPLKFGDRPRFAITYLRGYEGLGNARVTINDVSYELEGLWEPSHAKVTTSTTVWWSAASGRKSARAKADYEDGTQGFKVEKGSEHLVTIEFVGCGEAAAGRDCKFKVISVATC